MAIFVDQTGYLPNAPKIAISTVPCNYQVIRVSDQESVLDGTTSDMIADPCSGDNVYQIDFSGLTEPGEYYILAGNSGKSYNFTVGNGIYHKLMNDALKCLYYQRCGCELKPEHAGVYTHPACHTEPAILLNDYITQKENPQTFDMSGGWHDAGDFGRYTTAASVALAHVLYAYELFPDAFKDSLNIPESGNGIPDVLNECRYELTWLLKMQAPDGSVYHKLTAFRHADFIMPQDDHDRFLIYPPSSMAAGDFAAVMALASRIYRPFDNGFADEMLLAAKKAYKWLDENPFTPFFNPEGSNTGEYNDDADIDERLWASAELLRVDIRNKQEYLQEITSLANEVPIKTDFGWADVAGLASMSILTDPAHTAGMLEAGFKHEVLLEVARVADIFKKSGYNVGMAPEDFVWGSNMTVLNRAMLLALASRVAENQSYKEKYIKAAMAHLHYILGRNPLGICYVTGHGSNPFKNPHSRVTKCDGIDAPMPGWVSGGPFKDFCDPAALSAIPKGTAPMKCYVDDVGSYSTNEITIYWNSPLIFTCAFLESITL